MKAARVLSKRNPIRLLCVLGSFFSGKAALTGRTGEGTVPSWTEVDN